MIHVWNMIRAQKLNFDEKLLFIIIVKKKKKRVRCLRNCLTLILRLLIIYSSQAPIFFHTAVISVQQY